MLQYLSRFIFIHVACFPLDSYDDKIISWMHKDVAIEYICNLMQSLSTKAKEREWGDVLLAEEASKAQGWIVEGGDEEEDEEVYSCAGLTWRMVRIQLERMNF